MGYVIPAPRRLVIYDLRIRKIEDLVFKTLNLTILMTGSNLLLKPSGKRQLQGPQRSSEPRGHQEIQGPKVQKNPKLIIRRNSVRNQSSCKGGLGNKTESHYGDKLS